MILVTGATGTIGRELIKDLMARNVSFKAMVRTEEARAELGAMGIWTVMGNFDQPNTFAPALAGVGKVFMLTTPRPDLVKVEGRFLNAAREAGVHRVVRISAMGANPWGASPLIRGHGQCEAQLEASGLAWTMLRPTMFMQNLVPMYGDAVARTSTLFAPAGGARIPFVDTRDIAAVAGATLTTEGHESMVYELTGPEAFTYAGVAELLSLHLGRYVRFVDVPDEAAYHTMTDQGMPPWFAHALITLFHLFRANGTTAVAQGTIARLTGQAPRSLNAYLLENIKAFQGTRKADVLTHT